jgi:AraC-like DNA-binding protein
MNQTSPVAVPPRNYRDVSLDSNTGDASQLRDLFERVGVQLGATSAAVNLLIGPNPETALLSKSRRSEVHQNRHIELAVVLEGRLNLWWEGDFTTCPTSSVLVIPARCRYLPHCEIPGQRLGSHSVVWIVLNAGGGTIHTCHFEVKTHYLGEYFTFNEPQTTGITRVMAQELATRSDHFETVIRSLVSCLLIWLSRASILPITSVSSATPPQGTETQLAPENDFQGRVESYLLGHYHRPLSLPEVARALGCSPSFLCRRYRQITGHTPFRRLRDIRIEAAKRLLQSDLSITRIAEMVGFDDVFYFSRVFSKVEGKSPQSYQKQMRSESQ